MPRSESSSKQEETGARPRAWSLGASPWSPPGSVRGNGWPGPPWEFPCHRPRGPTSLSPALASDLPELDGLQLAPGRRPYHQDLQWEAFPCLLWLERRPGWGTPTDELELIRPSVYRNVARQLNLSLQSETVVTDAFLAVATQIFSAGITWGKVVSLYSVAAGLAVDCVRQAQPALVHALVDCLGEFVRKTLATWLRRRGGWTDVLKCVVSTDPGLRSHWLVAALCSFGRFLKAAFFMLLPER
ncbi:bcl-2-related ovarian killer protein isoform X5 [Ovis canadensis]|uniref:bcl-2-related ovarian killer protein isoform X5 n=1 Tax=Ovis canadensis TaxID=37174 RepID=UPI00374FF342